MPLKTECEIKIFPVSIIEITNKIVSRGGTMVQERTLMRRTVFGSQANPQIDATYIRVRDEGSRVRLSVKQVGSRTGQIADQKELDTIVDSYTDTVSILEHAGLKVTSIQENYRTTYTLNNCEIVIDEWPALAPYIEIEGPDEETVKSVCDILNLDWSKRLFISTDVLYAMQYGVSDSDALTAISIATFDEPPVFGK